MMKVFVRLHVLLFPFLAAGNNANSAKTATLQSESVSNGDTKISVGGRGSPPLRRKLGRPQCGDGTCRKSCEECGDGSAECTTCVAGGDLGNECSGGVHVCDFTQAFEKCGLKGGKNNQRVDDPRLRNVVCCCHSDTCPSACCETSITEICGGNLDDAMDDEPMKQCMDENIQACNLRGSGGDGETFVDMVAKCALWDDTTDTLYCPSGGATDPILIPPNEICNASSTKKCTNPWCKSADYNSCSDDSTACLCEEQSPP